jgi:hypothetical protein
VTACVYRFPARFRYLIAARLAFAQALPGCGLECGQSCVELALHFFVSDVGYVGH